MHLGAGDDTKQAHKDTAIHALSRIIFYLSLPFAPPRHSFGYFEGTFIKGSNNALLAWYETTSTDKDGLQSNLGGAQVAYSSDFATVSGGFNVAGITASLGSYSAWKSVKGQLQETSADNAAANNFRDYCLLVRPDGKEWSDVMGSAASSAGSDYFQSAPDGTALQALPDLDRANFASEQVGRSGAPDSRFPKMQILPTPRMLCACLRLTCCVVAD